MVFYVKYLCGRHSMSKRPVEVFCMSRRPVEGFICLQVLWKVFYVLKTYGWYSMYRRHMKGISSLMKVFFLEDL